MGTLSNAYSVPDSLGSSEIYEVHWSYATPQVYELKMPNRHSVGPVEVLPSSAQEDPKKVLLSCCMYPYAICRICYKELCCVNRIVQ